MDNLAYLKELTAEISLMQTVIQNILEEGIDDYWWASNDENFREYNWARKYFLMREKSESDRKDVMDRLR